MRPTPEYAPGAPLADHSSSHTSLVAACVEYLRWQPRIKAWKANTGAARIQDAGGRTRFVKFGVSGQADITGVVAPHGKRLEIECKTGVGRLSPAQASFQDMIVAQGAYYIVVRCLSDLAREVEAILNEVF